MVAGIRITPEQLASIAAQVQSGSAHISGELRQLSAQVAPLGSDWAGVAQVRFQALWEQWQRDAAGLQQALTGISSLMSQAGEHYAAAERAIAASFSVM